MLFSAISIIQGLMQSERGWLTAAHPGWPVEMTMGTSRRRRPGWFATSFTSTIFDCHVHWSAIWLPYYPDVGLPFWRNIYVKSSIPLPKPIHWNHGMTVSPRFLRSGGAEDARRGGRTLAVMDLKDEPPGMLDTRKQHSHFIDGKPQEAWSNERKIVNYEHGSKFWRLVPMVP